MNNIKIEKVWQDEDFYEVSISCFNESIIAEVLCYTTDQLMDELAVKIKKYITQEIDSFEWEIGDWKFNKLSGFKFKVLPADKHGRVIVHVFMRIFKSHYEYEVYNNCDFVVVTEFGLLENFGKQLCKIKEWSLGIEVSLFE